MTSRLSKTLIIMAVLILVGNAFSQGTPDTAYVPFVVNVAATVKAELKNGGTVVSFVQKSAEANKEVILPIPLQTTATLLAAHARQNAAVISNGRGKIAVNLPTQSYKNAEIALFSVNGKRVLSGKAVASKAENFSVSRPNIARGIYLLSVTGTDGGAITSRLTHGGGSLSVDLSFVDENSPPTRLLTKAAAAGDRTITVSAAESGYTDTTYLLALAAGTNPRQTITLRTAVFVPFDSTGFKPEMLGIVPGATTAELRFAWYSDDGTANAKSFVRLYSSSGAVVSTDSGEARTAAPAKKLYHKAAVKNLTPNTEYRYSVSNNGTAWSRQYKFKTPGAGAFTFAVLSDQHLSRSINDGVGTLPTWKIAMKKAASHNVDFILGPGDQVDSLKYEHEYTDFFAPPEIQSIPFAPVMGNHDIDSLFIWHYNLPNVTGKTLMQWSSNYKEFNGYYGNYWYLYNNVLFVALNTGGYLFEFSGQTKKAIAESTIKTFDSTFIKAKAAHAGKYDWIFVQHHKSTESTASHAEDEEILIFKEAGFEPLMDKHGVDLVIAGHDHVYVRTHPMKGGKVAGSGEKGVIYITATSSTKSKFYPEVSALYGKSQIARHSQTYSPGYAVFSVNGKSVTGYAYQAELNRPDTLFVKKDSLFLSK